MRIIKLLLLSLFSLAFVVTLISFFLPSHIRISRTVLIGAGKEVVMQELTDPVKWKDWYPGADSLPLYYEAGKIKGLVVKKDPGLILIINGIKENEVSAFYDRGKNKKELHTTWRVFPEIDTNYVTVQWYVDFQMNWYPWEKFSSLIYLKYYGSQMESGLANLKNKLEGK